MSKDYEEFIEKNIKSKNLDLNSVEVTIDISMYPNKEDFIEPIKNFIEKLTTTKI